MWVIWSDAGHSLYTENPVPVFVDSGPLWSCYSEMVEILLREIFILIWVFFFNLHPFKHLEFYIHTYMYIYIYIKFKRALTTSDSTPFQKKVVPWELDLFCLRFLKKNPFIYHSRNMSMKAKIVQIIFMAMELLDWLGIQLILLK